MTIRFGKGNAHLPGFDEIEVRSRDSKTRYGGRRQAQSSLSARCSGHSSLSVVRQALLSMPQPSPLLRMPRMSHSLRIAPSSAEGCVKYCLAQAKSSFQRPSLSERLRSRSKPCCRRVLRRTASEAVGGKSWEGFLWGAVQLVGVAGDPARDRRVCGIGDGLSARVGGTLARDMED